MSDDDDGDYELLALGRAIRMAVDGGIDPYVVAGLMAEGAAYAISHVPIDECDHAAAALLDLLRDRLKMRGYE